MLRRPIEERFWEKVDKTEGCWIWKASRNSSGYGQLSTERGKGPVLAHRLSWLIHFGEIPKNRKVLQTCRNLICVRPDHLRLSPSGGSVKEKLNDYTVVRPSGCIEWVGATAHGYGNINLGGNKWRLAHRVAWELEHGPVQDGLWVLHSCDNPLCVNVEHLFLGTHDDNMEDMVSKGRSRKGVEHHNARLCDQDVCDIRYRHAAGENRQKIAADYGIAPGYVNKIVRREVWAHVE